MLLKTIEKDKHTFNQFMTMYLKKYTVQWFLVPLILSTLMTIYPQTGRAQAETSVRYIYEDNLGEQLKSGAISPDGRLLAVVGNKKKVSLFSLPDGQPKQQLMLAEDYGDKAAFDPTGKLLAVGTNGQEIEIFDVSSGERKHTVRCTSLMDGTKRSEVCDGEFQLLRYLGQDSLLVVTYKVVSLWTPSGDRRMLLNFWEFYNNSIQHADRYTIQSASVSANKEILAVGFENGIINLYDIRKLPSISLLKSFRVPPVESNINVIESVAVNTEGNLLFGGASDGLRVWNINSGEEVMNDKYRVLSMSLSPKGDMIGISYASVVQLKTPVGSLLSSVDSKQLTHTVILSPDSKYLVGIEALGNYTGVWVKNIEAERLAAPKAEAKLKAQQAAERVKEQRAAEALQAERVKKERQLQADIAKFRSGLKAGSETSCGPVIEIKGELVKVYFPVANYGNEHWIRRSQLFPPGFGCRFVNGQYQPPTD